VKRAGDRLLFAWISVAFAGMLFTAGAAQERRLVIDPGHGGVRDVDESSARWNANALVNYLAENGGE
jgi:predicted deacylase